MPTYSYECRACGEITNAFHGMSAAPKVACGSCGSKRTKKLLGTGAGIIFKGSGFYETDYKRNGNGTNGSKNESASEKKAESKSESKSDSSSSKSDSKSDSKGSTKNNAA